MEVQGIYEYPTTHLKRVNVSDGRSTQNQEKTQNDLYFLLSFYQGQNSGKEDKLRRRKDPRSYM